MTENAAERAREMVDVVYRSESRRVLATLIRLLGDFDLAEEAMQEAFVAAVERWPLDGVPSNPRAWLISTGRFKAIDSLRRRARFDQSLGRLRVHGPHHLPPCHQPQPRGDIIATWPKVVRWMDAGPHINLN